MGSAVEGLVDILPAAACQDSPTNWANAS